MLSANLLVAFLRLGQNCALTASLGRRYVKATERAAAGDAWNAHRARVRAAFAQLLGAAQKSTEENG